MLAEEATRETFANLPVWAIAFWYFLIFVSTGILFYGIYRLARKYRQGRGPVEVDRPARRAGETLKIVLSHSWIRRRDPLSGFAHLFVFYGFMVLFVGTAILAVQDDLLGPLGFEFWKGWFYKGYSLFLDVFGACADRRPDRARRETRDHPTLPPRLLASGSRRGRERPVPLRARRLALPRSPVLPRPVGLPARGIPDRGDEPVVRGVVADRLGRGSGLPHHRLRRRRRVDGAPPSTGGFTASSHSPSSPRSRSRRPCT